VLPRLNSLATRIMLLHIVAVIATASVMPLALYWFLYSEADTLQRRAMRAQAEALQAHLTVRSDGTWTLDIPPGLRDLYSEAYGRYAYAILDASGNVRFSSRKDRTSIFVPKDVSAAAEFAEVPLGERVVTGASFRKDMSGRPIWVQVSEDLEHRDALIDDVVANFFQRAIWVTAPILMLLLAIDWLIFRRAVQPLIEASDQAGRISPTRTDIRLPTSDIPDEVLPLVLAVNKAFDRLEEGFRRERNFTADAAHELRTPLAILRSRIETLLDANAARPLLRDVDGMSRVVSQMLDAAELDTLVVDISERADLRSICADVVESIAPLAFKQEKSIGLIGPDGPIWIKGNAEMVQRAVRNLVENALNHTPRATDVEVSVTTTGTVSVLDHGSGIPPADRERIFERFWRSPARRNSGAGLGLSIVRRIVQAHGGTLEVRHRPTGGAEFSVQFLDAETTPQPSTATCGNST
jgi:signal transduction histidine kinase